MDDETEEGYWYSAESLHGVKTPMLMPHENARVKWDSSAQNLWIPWDLAKKLGLPYGGGWTRSANGDLKRPNTKGVLEYLSNRCRAVRFG